MCINGVQVVNHQRLTSPGRGHSLALNKGRTVFECIPGGQKQVYVPPKMPPASYKCVLLSLHGTHSHDLHSAAFDFDDDESTIQSMSVRSHLLVPTQNFICVLVTRCCVVSST